MLLLTSPKNGGITVVADLGTFTRADGSTGTAGTAGKLADIDLAQDSFHSQFTDSVPLTPEAQTLPDIQGAGMVRSLREAASLSPALTALLEQFMEASNSTWRLAA